MRNLSLFLLIVSLFMTAIISCSEGGENESKVQERVSHCGLYQGWTHEEADIYIYLYPDNTGVGYRSRGSDYFTWTSDSNIKADLFLDKKTDSTFYLNNYKYKKIFGYNPGSTDPKLIGKWEIVSVETIFPVKYDPLFDEISYEKDAVIEKRTFVDIDDYVKQTKGGGGNSLVMEFFKENVARYTKVSCFSENFFENTIEYTLHDGILSDYKVEKNKISYTHGNPPRYSYKIEGNEMEYSYMRTSDKGTRLYRLGYRRDE